MSAPTAIASVAMGRPARGVPDPLYRHYVLVAVVASALMLVAVPLVIVLARLPVEWPVAGAGLGVAGAAMVVALVLPWDVLGRRRGGQVFLYAWSLVDLGAISAGVAATGGQGSWLWVLFVLTTIFFAVGYPLRGQVVLLLATLTGLLCATIVSSSVAPANLVWKMSIIVAVFVLGSFPGWELRRQAAEQARARQDADMLADALAEREEWWRSLLEHTSDPIVVFDRYWRITFASPSLGRLLGYRDQRRAPIELMPLVHPDDVESVRQAIATIGADASRLCFACRLRREDGTWRDVEVSLADVQGPGRGRIIVANLHDVTERVAAEAALGHRATHDSLTDLANRTAFYSALQTSATIARLSDLALSVMMLDLENFKEVNDTFGHAVGDELLVEVGRRLHASLPDAAVVARLGADEFAAVLPAGTDGDGSTEGASKVAEALAEPVVLAGQPYWLRASIGVACHTGREVGPEELVQRADRAMHEAKRTGTIVAPWTPDLQSTGPSHVRLLGELRRAIGAGELRLFFQPKISLRTEEVVGVEALVRWQHPRLGLLGPASFLPVAEASGLVRELTAWVLPTALSQLARWLRSGHQVSMAVNLSAQDLADEQFGDQVARWLEDAGVPTDRVILELTETSAISDHERGSGVLQGLRAKGLRVSLDDFGSGYSSLAYLSELPLDELKLDSGFLRASLEHSGFLLRSVVEIGHHLGLVVVAEGVETMELCKPLATLGCDVVQGHAYSPPLPPAALVALLERWSREAPRAAAARRTPTRVRAAS